MKASGTLELVVAQSPPSWLAAGGRLDGALFESAGSSQDRTLYSLPPGRPPALGGCPSAEIALQRFGFAVGECIRERENESGGRW